MTTNITFEEECKALGLRLPAPSITSYGYQEWQWRVDGASLRVQEWNTTIAVCIEIAGECVQFHLSASKAARTVKAIVQEEWQPVSHNPNQQTLAQGRP